VDSWDKRIFLPEPVREYQIRRSRFPGDTWRVRFELTEMTEKNESLPVIVLPSDSNDHDPADWFVLDLK